MGCWMFLHSFAANVLGPLLCPPPLPMSTVDHVHPMPEEAGDDDVTNEREDDEKLERAEGEDEYDAERGLGEGGGELSEIAARHGDADENAAGEIKLQGHAIEDQAGAERGDGDDGGVEDGRGPKLAAVGVAAHFAEPALFMLGMM